MPSLLNNLFWKFGERSFAQIVTFVVSIVLARILEPKEYGAIAMVTVFINVANVLVEGGFSSALIQKKVADKLDFSTVLYFSVVFSIILYLLLYFFAPSIALFYGDGYEILCPVLRVLGLQVVIYAINSVQQAYVARRMMFRNFFWATLIGTISSGILGIIMAISGFGIWALVVQQLSLALINTFTLFLITRKMPVLQFSFARLKGLIDYGIKILGASLLITGYQEMRALIIGKFYSSKDLAYFDRARQFPNLIVNNINTSIGAVLFPRLALEQNNIEQIKSTTRMSIRTSAYLMSPLMFVLLAMSEPLVRIILTDKWIACVPLLQLFCILNLFQPIHTANLQAIKAIGRSDIFFYLEIIKKSIDLVAFLFVMRVSVYAIVFSMTALCALFTIVNAYPNIKLLNYTIKEQINDILPPILMSVVMCILVYSLSCFIDNPYTLVLIQSVIGFIVYVILSMLTSNKEYIYLLQIVKTRVSKR